jgi:hypothetical protein
VQCWAAMETVWLPLLKTLMCTLQRPIVIPCQLPTSTQLFPAGASHTLAVCTVQALELIMSMPGVRTTLTPQQRAKLGRAATTPSLHERATVYLLLAEVLTRLSTMPDPPEAKKVPTSTLGQEESKLGRCLACIAQLCYLCGKPYVPPVYAQPYVRCMQHAPCLLRKV